MISMIFCEGSRLSAYRDRRGRWRVICSGGAMRSGWAVDVYEKSCPARMVPCGVSMYT